METISDVVLARAVTTPNHLAYRFYRGGLDKSDCLTFRDVWQQASALAYFLSLQVPSGERALIVCKSQQHFVLAFYACLFAGIVAVPCAVPRRSSLCDRLKGIVDNCSPKAIIVDFDDFEPVHYNFALSKATVIDVRRSVPDFERDSLARLFLEKEFRAKSIAFIQYTSGSTGNPKGVIVTHKNVIENSLIIKTAMSMSETTDVLMPLPLFHDMGLIGGVLQSMFSGCTTNFIPPNEMVMYPERWLRLISSTRATVSGGPNFIFHHAATSIRMEEVDGVDLSGWRVAFCGAEPICSETLSLFCDKFESIGFRKESFLSCYGMAESTLYITGSDVGRPPTTIDFGNQTLVSCGRPRLNTDVAIVNPKTMSPLSDGTCGEIWTRSTSVADGYWNHPELTAITFQARLPDGTGPYLRTGDLGLLSDGELFVVGRLKDMIIVRGQKYSPQDMEDTICSCHDGIRYGCAVLFGLPNEHGEKVVAVVELERKWLKRSAEIQSLPFVVCEAVLKKHGMVVSEVILIRPGCLPRTSSGKVRRTLCKEQYINGAFDRI